MNKSGFRLSAVGFFVSIVLSIFNLSWERLVTIFLISIGGMIFYGVELILEEIKKLNKLLGGFHESRPVHALRQKDEERHGQAHGQ